MDGTAKNVILLEIGKTVCFFVSFLKTDLGYITAEMGTHPTYLLLKR